MRTGGAPYALAPESRNAAGMAGRKFRAPDEENLHPQENDAKEKDRNGKKNGFHILLSLRRCKYKQKYVFIFAIPILFSNLEVET